MEMLCREAGFEPRVAFEVDETTAVQALVAAKVGVTLLPRLALSAVHPGVVVRKVADTPMRRVWAARLEGAYPSPASDAMLQTLEDVAEEFREAKLELAG
jgi:DNA-binding transcriptional LysR family regulator